MVLFALLTEIGTVLLNKEAQGANQISFQKYVTGILDLLLSSQDKEIVDHYGKEEILFLGPDENTADQMDWAALYAKKRGTNSLVKLP